MKAGFLIPVSLHKDMQRLVYARLDAVDWAVLSGEFPPDFMERAVDKGYTKLLDWYISLGRKDPTFTQSFEVAYRNGDLETIRWSLKYQEILPSYLISAARNGRLNVFETFSRSILIEHSSIIAAAEGGHLELILWFKARVVAFWPVMMVIRAATTKGHLAIIQWAAEQPVFPIGTTFILARENNQPHITDWLEERFPNFDLHEH